MVVGIVIMWGRVSSSTKIEVLGIESIASLDFLCLESPHSRLDKEAQHQTASD